MASEIPSRLDDYETIVGETEIRDLRRLAEPLRGRKLQHLSSTLVGGGVAELLTRMTPMYRDLGLEARWDVLQADPEFFSVTKSFHNALHGAMEEITPECYATYLQTTERNLKLVDQEADFVMAHDPQPLGLVNARKPAPAQHWVWRCHIDISEADPRVWGFLRSFVERCDTAFFHLAEYAKDLLIPQVIVTPAIDPLDEKNRELRDHEIRDTLIGCGIDPDRPIVLQVSRFDRLKDPLGVVAAYRLVRKWHDCQLVLAGGTATDDPEGATVLAEVQEAAAKDPDIHILALPPVAHRTINALQRGATVIVQKSIREGFGLVVTEAMWKGKPVIGGAVGGIRRQIHHGTNGLLVRTVAGTAFRIRQCLSNPGLAQRLGRNAHRHVAENYLITRYLKNTLLAFHSLHTQARISPVYL